MEQINQGKNQNKDELIKLVHLKKYFNTPKGLLHAVDDINLVINKGETLGVVGESGCGKSTMGRAILRLHEPTSGEVYFKQQNILNYDSKKMNQLREQMQIIFQDPFASLNPRMTVKESIIDPLIIQKKFSKKDNEGLSKRAKELMDMVGLASRLVNTYPHELDGGRRQRIGIARALALNPEFIVCDEPVSALDVSIQAQILNLMQDLQKELGLTYMFVTHNLSVVKHLSDDIAVMYLGQLVEKCSSKRLFENPMHPYTKALLSAIPVPDPDYKMDRVLLKGELTSPISPQPGCRFAKRCIYVKDKCTAENIELVEAETDHFVSCCRLLELDL